MRASLPVKGQEQTLAEILRSSTPQPKLRHTKFYKDIPEISSPALETDEEIEHVILNGFQLPFDNDIDNHRSDGLIRQPNGYYRKVFLVLQNNELYVYPENGKKQAHHEVYILAPRVFVRSIDPI